MSIINRLLDVPSIDPDDARRRKLLNILLVGLGFITFLALLWEVFYRLSNVGEPSDNPILLVSIIIMLGGIFVIYLINKYWVGWVASTLFLLLLTGVLAFSDTPEEVIAGRSLFLLVIPIPIASVVLPSYASFVIASVVSALLSALSLHLDRVPDVFAMFGFFVIALVSWLSSRALEQALHDLRGINRELDERVAKRTEELAEANTQLVLSNNQLADANQKLEHANERLKELDRLKSQFVSMVSHELRTPLNAIQGFAEMLDAGIYGTLSGKQQGAVERITTNADRLLNIVNELLDQARIEAGQIALQNAPFVTVGLMDDLESTVGVLTENKGLTLITHVETDMPETLYGDRERLHQVLVNLVNNAIKYTERGSIRVDFYRFDTDHWAADITDTGPGIPVEAQAYIFEPFRQVDGSETRTYRGVGLGLSIVKQLVQLMGGRIKLESEVGKGTTFTVVLPFTPPRKEVNHE